MTELKLKVQTGFFKRVAAIAMAVCLSVGMLPEAVSAENAAGKGTVESISITPNGPVELTEKGQTVTLTANEIGRASCRERVSHQVLMSGVGGA